MNQTTRLQHDVAQGDATPFKPCPYLLAQSQYCLSRLPSLFFVNRLNSPKFLKRRDFAFQFLQAFNQSFQNGAHEVSPPFYATPAPSKKQGQFSSQTPIFSGKVISRSKVTTSFVCSKA